MAAEGEGASERCSVGGAYPPGLVPRTANEEGTAMNCWLVDAQRIPQTSTCSALSLSPLFSLSLSTLSTQQQQTIKSMHHGRQPSLRRATAAAAAAWWALAAMGHRSLSRWRPAEDRTRTKAGGGRTVSSARRIRVGARLRHASRRLSAGLLGGRVTPASSSGLPRGSLVWSLCTLHEHLSGRQLLHCSPLDMEQLLVPTLNHRPQRLDPVCR